MTWNALVNRDVVTLFKGCDWLGPEELATAYVSRVARRAYLMVNPHAAWRNAGNLIHYALRLGLVAEAQDPARGRGWRLVHEDPQWIVEGEGARRHARQIRGLPPEQQAAEDRRQAKLAKLAATLDRKARLAADGKIAEAVAEILRHAPDFVVPENWARTGPVPAWAVGVPLDEAAAVVREAHHAAEMPRRRLRSWLPALWNAADNASALYHETNRRAVARPTRAEIPAADADALEALL
ncbi:hypothetical protein BV511_15650 [Methylorubrum extorquens]|uniref:hypothetical protein n=1 Tax=Methylorubrum extorquens TaxID=408 RepID=UPI000972A1D9|nr:hypothetical protein [Methylorubrum extorquens]APX86008.1 hypothetical protein BV511_15650 [Methylorubrum extorquens]